MKPRGQVFLHAAPHFHDPTTTPRIMWTTVVCLLPAGAWGCWMYGMRSLLIIGVAVLAAAAGELAANLLSHRLTLSDGSAVLSGLLVAYILPPGVPLYVPAAASLFAMLVIKATFGGLGANWMNPAVGGQVFAYFSWTSALSAWSLPRAWLSDVSAGPPLGVSPLQFLAGQASRIGSAELHQGAATLLRGYPASNTAKAVADWLSQTFRFSVDPHFLDLAAGSVPGDIGSVSPILLLLGAAYLFHRRFITWHAPAGFLASFLLFVWIFGGVPENRGWFTGFPLFQLFTGSTILAAFFLCTDPVTSPLSRHGMLVYGIGIGFFAFLMRVFGGAEEAVFLAILLMNIAVPAIDQLAERKRHAW